MIPSLFVKNFVNITTKFCYDSVVCKRDFIKPTVELAYNRNHVKVLCKQSHKPDAIRTQPLSTKSGFRSMLSILLNDINARKSYQDDDLFAKCFPAHRHQNICLNGGYTSYAESPIHKGYFPAGNWQWYVQSKDRGESVTKTGGGIGKLDAANEDGYFFKLNQSRLKKLKQLLKKANELKSKETPPEKKSK